MGRKLKAFIITLSNNQKSIDAARRCISSYSECVQKYIFSNKNENALPIELSNLFDIKLETFPAISPGVILESQRIIQNRNHKKFQEALSICNEFITLTSDWKNPEDTEKFSNLKNAQCAFHSHYCLWQKCIELNEPILILEHDAVFNELIPDIQIYLFKRNMMHNFTNMSNSPYNLYFNENIPYIFNYGKPSYGNYIDIPLNANILECNNDEMNYINLFPFFSKPGGYLGGAHAYMINPSAAKKLTEFSPTQPVDLFINKKDFPFLYEYWPWPISCDDRFSSIQKKEGCKAKHGYKDNEMYYIANP